MKFRAATYNVYYKVRPADVVRHANLLRDQDVVTILLIQEINVAKMTALTKEGWKVIKHPKTSNAVAWRPEVWRAIKHRHVTLAQDYSDETNKGRKVSTASPLVQLQHLKTRQTVWALSYHLPSRVQRKNPSPARRKVQKQAVRKLDSLAKDLPGPCLFGGDDNTDERTGSWPWMTSDLKHLVQVVAPAWTHGRRRRIDDFRIKGLQPGPGRVLPSRSDHRTHVRTFTTTAKEALVAKSQNGWPVLASNSPKLHTWKIPTKHGVVRLRLRNGSAGFILAWVILRWAEKFEPVAGKVLDDWGYAYRPVRGKTTGFSNHASGTAADVNATRWPLGTTHMTAKQRARVLYVISIARTVVRWGGNYSGRKDQMHLEINKSLATCERLAKVLMKTPRGKRILGANPGQKRVIFS